MEKVLNTIWYACACDQTPQAMSHHYTKIGLSHFSMRHHSRKTHGGEFIKVFHHIFVLLDSSSREPSMVYTPNEQALFVYFSTDPFLKTPVHVSCSGTVGGTVKKMLEVGCTDYAFPTSFDRIKRQLSVASAHCSENKQPSALLCHSLQNNSATLFVWKYLGLNHLSGGIMCIRRIVLIPIHSGLCTCAQLGGTTIPITLTNTGGGRGEVLGNRISRLKKKPVAKFQKGGGWCVCGGGGGAL